MSDLMKCPCGAEFYDPLCFASHYRECPQANCSPAPSCSAESKALQALVDSQTFWDEQPYGSRLYYGDGPADFLRRETLRAVIKEIREKNEERTATR